MTFPGIKIGTSSAASPGSGGGPGSTGAQRSCRCWGRPGLGGAAASAVAAALPPPQLPLCPMATPWGCPQNSPLSEGLKSHSGAP